MHTQKSWKLPPWQCRPSVRLELRTWDALSLACWGCCCVLSLHAATAWEQVSAGNKTQFKVQALFFWLPAALRQFAVSLPCAAGQGPLGACQVGQSPCSWCSPKAGLCKQLQPDWGGGGEQCPLVCGRSCAQEKGKITSLYSLWQLFHFPAPLELSPSPVPASLSCSPQRVDKTGIERAQNGFMYINREAGRKQLTRRCDFQLITPWSFVWENSVIWISSVVF